MGKLHVNVVKEMSFKEKIYGRWRKTITIAHLEPLAHVSLKGTPPCMYACIAQNNEEQPL